MALYGEDYDPLLHLSTPLSLLPHTLARIGFSLPVGLSEVDQIEAFFHHMHGVLQKGPKSGIMCLEKSSGPNSRSIDKERYEAGKKCSVGQKQDCKLESLKSTKIMQQSSIRSYNSRSSSNPDSINRDGTGRSFEVQQLDVKLESSESMLEQQSYMMEPQPDIISYAIANKLSLSPDSTKMEINKAGSISSESVEFTDKEQRHSETIRVNKQSPNRDSVVQKKDKFRNFSSEEKNDLDFRSVDSMLEPGLSISGGSHNPGEVLDKAEMERDISVKNSSHPEQKVVNKSKGRRPGLGLNYNISPFTIIQKPEKTVQVVTVDFTVLDHISDPDVFTKKAYELEAAVKEITRLGCQPKIIGERVFRVVEDDQPRNRCPGLGLQMSRPKFVPLPMRPLPAKPSKVNCACQNRAPTQRTVSLETKKVKALSRAQNEAPASISNATREVPEMNLHTSSSLQKLLSNLESCPDDDDEKTVAMVHDWLNLKPTVITPLVIPEMPKFSKFDDIRSPWGQLPSIEQVRGLKGEDPLVAFEELRKKFFTGSPAADYSDDDTTPLVGVDSFRSPSMSPDCMFSFENEEIDTPSLAGPSGNPNVENEQFPFQEKVPEMTSDARGDGNFSDEDIVGDYIPDEPEMSSPQNNSPVNIENPLSSKPEMTSDARCDGNFSDEDIGGDYIPDEPEMSSPQDNSPVNIENALSSMPLENSPVNGEVEPSNIMLENNPEDGDLEVTSSKIGKKRGLEHADSNIPTPTSDNNAQAQTETSLLEPPKDRDAEMAPPEKKSKKQARRSSIRIIEGGLQEVDGVRRSTRIRSRPLRHWMGERFLYGRIEDNIISALGVKECSPATLGVRVKVRSFVSDKYADLVARIAQ